MNAQPSSVGAAAADCIIVREWRGRVPADLAGAYVGLMQAHALVDYRSVEGNLAASRAVQTSAAAMLPRLQHLAAFATASSAVERTSSSTAYHGGPMARNPVLSVKPAPSDVALEHFSRELMFETDCADVHEAMQGGDPGFVLIDARGPSQYAAGHVPGAINIPHGKIIGSRMAAFSDETLFVVYCDGPHCNGATRAAIRLASLGRPVKKMVGGLHGWMLDGYSLAKQDIEASI